MTGFMAVFLWQSRKLLAALLAGAFARQCRLALGQTFGLGLFGSSSSIIGGFRLGRIRSLTGSRFAGRSGLSARPLRRATCCATSRTASLGRAGFGLLALLDDVAVFPATT